jgi:hypothetical protein
MAAEPLPDDFLKMPIPSFDATLLDDYERLLGAMSIEWKSASQEDPRLEPFRREHEDNVKRCLEGLTEENALEVRARLRAAHDALEFAEKRARAMRSAEELSAERSLQAERTSRLTELQHLAKSAWNQASLREAEVAELWKAKCLAELHKSDEFTIGLMLLSMASTRRKIDAVVPRRGTDVKTE